MSGKPTYEELERRIRDLERRNRVPGSAADDPGAGLPEPSTGGARFRSLFENVKDPIYRMSLPDGRYEYVSPSSIDLFGYTPEEIFATPKFIEKILHPDWVEYFNRQWNRLVSGTVPPAYEYQIIDRSGAVKWLHQRNVLVWDEGGRPKAIEAIVSDITASKRTEQSLRKAEQQLKLILDQVPALIWQKDRHGTYMLANKAFLDVHGRTEEEIIGRTDGDIFTTELAERYAAADRRVLDTGQPILGIEEPLQKPFGELGWSRKDKLVYRDAQGDVAGTIGFAVDITEVKRAEAQVHQLQKAESLSRMAGAVAHHFNNQLGVVQGNVELALDQVAHRPEVSGFLRAALQACRQAADLGGLMLTYLGHEAVTDAPVDLSEACRRHLRDFQESLPAGIAFETDLPASGPRVRGSENQVRRILVQLLTNAVEALGDRRGRVTLAIRSLPAARLPRCRITPVDWQPTSDVYACMKVADSGCGMSETDVDRLFDPFFTTKFLGRGLGLPVVLGILKAAGGAIGVESETSRGSTVRVFWPVLADAGLPAGGGPDP